MSFSLIFGCIWVFIATVIATLPMRLQFPPGILLLIAAPLLIGWIGWEHGILPSLIGLFAFISMFRRPLWHIWSKVRSSKEVAP